MTGAIVGHATPTGMHLKVCSVRYQSKFMTFDMLIGQPSSAVPGISGCKQL